MSDTVTDDGRTRFTRDQLLQRAVDAEAAGHFLETIDLLCDANREAADADIEYRLVNTRQRAFNELLTLPPAAGPAESPIAVPTGTECEGTIPRVDVDELTPAVLRSCIASAGCVHVPALFDAATVRLLRDGIDTALNEWAALRRPYANRTRSPWFDPMQVDDEEERAGLGRKWVNNSGGLLTADSPRTMFQLLEKLDAVGLRRLATAFLGERPTLSANKCTIRRVPVESNSGWHQDGAFLGDGIRALNIWITLTPCGRDAPGLELLPRRLDYIVETGSRGAYFDWAVGAELIDELTHDGVGVVRPEFGQGDALLFDDYLLHRTAVDPSMTQPRYAFETWSFAASAYPQGHVPIVW